MLELVVDIDLSTLNVSGQGRMQLLNLILMYTFNPTIPLYHYYDHYTTPLPLVHKLATKYSQKASKRQYGNIHIIQMIIQEKEMVHTASTASITGGGGGGGKQIQAPHTRLHNRHACHYSSTNTNEARGTVRGRDSKPCNIDTLT